MLLNDWINIWLCHDVCIKNILLQFLVKWTCVESVSVRGQSYYFAHIFCVVYSTNEYELIKSSFFFLSVLGRVPFFHKWLKLFFILSLSFSILFLFSSFSWFSEFRCWNMRFIISGFSILWPDMFHPIGNYLFSQFEYEIIFKVESKKGVVSSSLSWCHSYSASHDFSIYVLIWISGF